MTFLQLRSKSVFDMHVFLSSSKCLCTSHSAPYKITDYEDHINGALSLLCLSLHSECQ